MESRRRTGFLAPCSWGVRSSLTSLLIFETLSCGEILSDRARQQLTDAQNWLIVSADLSVSDKQLAEALGHRVSTVHAARWRLRRDGCAPWMDLTRSHQSWSSVSAVRSISGRDDAAWQ